MDPAPQTYRTTPEYTLPERRGVSRRTVIDAAKDKVETIELASLLCGMGKMRRSGARCIARCPLPDHEDRTPSFNVNTDTNSWFCYGCLWGGDVIELARFAWGYSKREALMAAAYLLWQFGPDIPLRPESWYRKQARQRPAREALDEVRIGVRQRRLLRLLCGDWLTGIRDPRARKAEAEAIRAMVAPVARQLYLSGRSSR